MVRTVQILAVQKQNFKQILLNNLPSSLNSLKTNNNIIVSAQLLNLEQILCHVVKALIRGGHLYYASCKVSLVYFWPDLENKNKFYDFQPTSY